MVAFPRSPLSSYLRRRESADYKILPDSVVLPRWSAEAPVRWCFTVNAVTTTLIRRGENAASLHNVDYGEYMRTGSMMFEQPKRSVQLMDSMQDHYRRTGVTEVLHTSTSTWMIPVDEPVDTTPRVVTEATVVDNVMIRDPFRVRGKGRPKGSKNVLQTACSTRIQSCLERT